METWSELYIDGSWQPPVNGQSRELISPVDESVWTRVAEGSSEDVDRAVSAARRAVDSGPWRDMDPAERAAIMRRAADIVREHAETLALVITRENGAPLRYTRRDTASHHEWWHYYAGAIDKLTGSTIPTAPDKLVYTTYEPIGVVALIVPWNFPLLILTWKLTAALAAGNAVVIKPADGTPVSALVLVGALEAAGFPPGVINVVTGAGQTVGRALAEHADVDKLSFTGSTRTARQLLVSAGGNLKRLALELGGKSAQMIFPDADLDRALDSAVENAFIYTGQSCTLGSRVLVHTDIYDEFVPRFVERAQRLIVGDPLSPDTDLGPHSSKEQLEKTLEYIEIGKAGGAVLALNGATTTDDHGSGYFVGPTVFTDVTSDMRIAKEEIFGPVVSIIRFSDTEDCIEIANSVDYGLTASIWTLNLSLAHQVARRIQAGTVWVNTFRYLRWTIPYGGVKQSGWGRENGLDSLREFSNSKSIVVAL